MENFIKYPKTFHLPWSLGISNDDKIISSLKDLEKAEEVVVTLKMDGENTSLYHNGCHARSLDSKYHESRNWVKQLQGSIAHLIPANYRLCGENLFAKHSIEYTNLNSYFYLFSLWEDKKCLSWDKTEDLAKSLGLELVPVIYRGKFNRQAIEKAFAPYKQDHEGYVVRVSSEFSIEQFSTCVGKYVRPNHVQTNDHWMTQAIIKNKLKT